MFLPTEYFIYIVVLRILHLSYAKEEALGNAVNENKPKNKFEVDLEAESLPITYPYDEDTTESVTKSISTVAVNILDEPSNNSNLNESISSSSNDTEEEIEEYEDSRTNISLATPFLDPLPTSPVPPASDPTEMTSFETKATVEDYCLCDLKINSCDVNCCCDPDCSDEDRKVFSKCQQRPHPVIGSEYCFQEHLIFRNHTEYKVDYNHPGTLCIVTDNNPQRTTYTSVQVANRLKDYDSIKKKIGRYYSWRADHHDKSFVEEPYRDGALIWAFNTEGNLFPFGIPVSVVGNECESTASVIYLQDTDTVCHQPLQDLLQDCASNMFLDAYNYLSFAVISDPRNFYQNESMETSDEMEIESTTDVSYITDSFDFTTQKTSSDTNEDHVKSQNLTMKSASMEEELFHRILDEYEGKLVRARPYICTVKESEEICTELHVKDIPRPVYEHGMCKNILSDVKYSFIHNGTDGIYDILAKVYFTNVTDFSVQVVQKYSVSFYWASSKAKTAFDRSGRPGYILGKPLLMGNLIKNVTDDGVIKEAISLSANPSHWMHILASDSNGKCNSSSAVTFGVDVRANCLFQIRQSEFELDCQPVQQRILKLLFGPVPLIKETLRIASYGDSDVNNPADWVPILIPEDPQCGVSNKLSAINSHFNLITSLHIEVAYSLQGSLANPQKKIIGMTLHFGESQTVKFPCFNAGCISLASFDGTTEVELITSVSFVDITKPPVPEYSKPPAIDIKLPYDFFYPFLPSKASYMGIYEGVVVGTILVMLWNCC
ncbi:hypothetical protein SK128_022278 [Halocaridina rubra]|uniref:Tectonic n=1 Tax=Halocaridina rubra TaxID=373956 RepID=A0AAN8WDC4_HALRR